MVPAFELLANISHLLVDSFLFKLTNPRAADIGDELWKAM
jgi:hypothetical protein